MKNLHFYRTSVKSFLFLIFFTAIFTNTNAQLNGTYSIPGSYPWGFATIKMAVDTLNAYGVSGNVIFNVAAGHRETNSNITIYDSTSTQTYTITFRKSGTGANPLVTASAGNSDYTDGIIEIGGRDYVTFDGIDLRDTIIGDRTVHMEYGYGIMKLSGTNGSQHITIKNCHIALIDSIFSIGILSANYKPTSNGPLDVTAFSGTNSYINISRNIIDSVRYGIDMEGSNNWNNFWNTCIVIDSNTLTRNSTYGSSSNQYIFCMDSDSLQISGNTISSTFSIKSCNAIDVNYINYSKPKSINIYNNKINLNVYDTTSSHPTGIRIIPSEYTIFEYDSDINIYDNIIENCSFDCPNGEIDLIKCWNEIDTLKMYNNIIRNISTTSTNELQAINVKNSKHGFIHDNQILNIKRYGSSGGGTTYAIYIPDEKAVFYTYTYNNIIRGVRHADGKSGNIIGYFNSTTPFSNYFNYNTIDSIETEGSGIVYGYYVSSDTTNYNPLIYGNKFSSLSSDSGSVFGIYCVSGHWSFIYNNNINNLISNSNPTGIVYGVYIYKMQGCYIYNNYISDLRTPVGLGKYSVVGINHITGRLIAFNNTVYLNASSSSDRFGTAAIYITTNDKVSLANNIFVNISTPKAYNYDYKTVAYRRSSNNLLTYDSTSNNNCFYTGSSKTDTTRVLFYDGTTSGGYDMDIYSYRARVFPRDSASFWENPPFKNVSTTPYNLRLDSNTATFCESGGDTLSLFPYIDISSDFDWQPRYPNSGYPNHASGLYNAFEIDVGADEFGGIPEISGPVITYTPFQNTSRLNSRNVSGISASDPSGVDFNTGTKPRIYYKKSTNSNSINVNDTTNAADGWKYSKTTGNSSPFGFEIAYSRIYGGVSVGDTIQYFVVAQDLSSMPNVGINSGIFASVPDSVNLQSPQFPITGTINRYVIIHAYKDTVNVGTGQTYTTLTGSNGLFNAINTGIVTGNITAVITSDITEPGTIALNQTIEELNYSITIQPDATVNRTLSGSCSGGLIKLNGADRITFDGRYSGAGNYLTFENTGTSGNSAVFTIISQGTGQGAVNNTIRNCNIKGGTNTESMYGISSGGSTPGSSGSDNDNLQILYNNISKCYGGIYIYGSSDGPHDSVRITGNSIGSNTPTDYVTYYGIIAADMFNSTISYNDIFNMKGNNDSYGMYFIKGMSYNRITKNRIHGLDHDNTSEYSKGCINFLSPSSTSNTIDNNAFYDYRMFGSTSNSKLFGLNIVAGTDYKIYYNSFSSTGAFRNTDSNCYSICLMFYLPATNVDMRNNSFYNSMTGNAPKTYTIYYEAGTTFTNINFNNYYTTGNWLGVANGIECTNFDSLKAQTGSDNNSKNADPLYNNATNLQLFPGSPLFNSAQIITGYGTDILDSARSGSAPTIGAYEKPNDPSPPDITYTLLADSILLNTRYVSGISAFDHSGVDFNAGTAPRIYYKKSTNSNVINVSDTTSATDGWKYSKTTGTSSPFGFEIAYSRIYGGVSLGDTIQYFIVAQDLWRTPNVGINSGTFTSPPASVSLQSAQFPLTGTINSYIIIPVYVGTGRSFATLTGSNGLFNAINTGQLTGDITAMITSNIIEPGTVALNQTSEDSYNRIRIIPDSDTLRLISGKYAGGLIRLNGADRVTIDGSYNGSGKYLKFRNSYISSAYTINLINDASDDSVRNCYIEGSSVPVYIGTSSTLGNNNNVFDNLEITDTLGGTCTTRPAYGIQVASAKANGTVIINSKIHNVSSTGYYQSGTSNGDSNTVINNNEIYRFGVYAIYMFRYGGQNNVIEGNLIYQDTANFTSSSNYGIYLDDAAANTNITVRKNKIYNLCGTSTCNLSGVFTYGNNVIINIYIYNNQISLGNSTTTMGDVAGIEYYGSSQNNCYIYYNSVYIGGSNVTGYSLSFALSKRQPVNNYFVKNNVFYNARSNSTGTGYHYAIYHYNTNPVNWLQDYNNLYVSGTGGVLGYYINTSYTTLAAWKTATKKDTNSISGNPGFTSFSNLTPDINSENSWNLNNKAIQISSIADDYNGASRPSTTTEGVPDIGAIEFTPAVAPPIATASGAPAPSTTTTYSQSGKTLASITWGSSKYQRANNKEQILTNNKIVSESFRARDLARNLSYATDALPSTVNVQFYSGTVPPDTVNMPIAKTGLGYYFFDANGEPSNPVNYVIYWGDEMLGNIGNTGNLTLAMYDLKNCVWLTFDTASSGNGYAIKNLANKTITVNGIPRVDSVIFALTGIDQPLKRLRLDLKCIIAGFWYDRGSGYNTMKPDTVTAIIRTTNPWTPVDSLKILLDSSGYGYGFTSIANLGTGYFIEINHRNSLSTWSSDSTTGFSRVAGTYLFDFTSSQGQAYGSNLIQVGTKWCIINGDVNRDDWIDGSDYLDIFNNYDTGGEFMIPDTNGDDWIDGSDYLAIFNNYDIGAVTPIYSKFLKPIRKKIFIQKEIMNK